MSSHPTCCHGIISPPGVNSIHVQEAEPARITIKHVKAASPPSSLSVAPLESIHCEWLSVKKTLIVPRVDAPSASGTFLVFLTKDRDMAQYIVNVYFEYLDFRDPGSLCSMYHLLALGTLSEFNHHAADAPSRPSMSKLCLTPEEVRELSRVSLHPKEICSLTRT
jgi:hypothetical protein